MTANIHSPVTELLQREGVAYDVIEIPLSEDRKPVRNLEELLSSRDLDPQSVVRSVLFKTASDKFVLLAVAGCATTSKPLPPLDCPAIELDLSDLPRAGETATQPILDMMLKRTSTPSNTQQPTPP